MDTLPCPVCRSLRTSPFLSQAHVPVHQNLLMPDECSARKVAHGDLILTLCHNCGFLFNQAFNLAKLSYGQGYDNTQNHSPTFKAHVDNLAARLTQAHNRGNSCVVEVGCGNGSFIRGLIEDWTNSVGFGFDPSYSGPSTVLDGRLKFYPQYYGSNCAHIRADLVVCRHVIEHVPDPIGLLQSVRQALAGSPEARVFFETPCLKWILSNHVIWDFFYEHCSYFTAESLSSAFELAGFKIEDVEHVFGGQYLWIEASVSAVPVSHTPKKNPLLSVANEYLSSLNQLRQGWQSKIANLRSRGKLALWGAGAKGVTFANMFDPEHRLIDCVVDLNPSKQQHFIPGTGHPIVDYRELSSRGVKTALLLNPNYRLENLSLLREARLDVELVE